MFESREERAVELGQRVQVYYNLNRPGGYYSIRSKGKVLGYAQWIHMRNVKFKVNLKGIHRIRENRRKEVVAFVEGEITSFTEVGLEGFKEISINPYENESFVDVHTGEIVTDAEYVVCHGKRVWVKE